MGLVAPHVTDPNFWKEPPPPSMNATPEGKVPQVSDPRIAGSLSDVASTASNMMPFGGPAEGAAALGMKAIFGGPMAKTANLSLLRKARDMEAGASPTWTQGHTIFDETGWFRGADGKWRFEIPDDNISVRIPS